jgi:hypothetical protein
MWLKKVWAPSTNTDLQTTHCRREFYGSGVSPRAFLQIRFRLTDPGKPLDFDQLAELVDALLAMPVRVATGSGEEVPLGEAGRSFAEYWRANSTSVRASEPAPRWSVSASRPLCVLTLDEIDLSPARSSSFVSIEHETKTHALAYARRSEADVWLVIGREWENDAKPFRCI